MWDTKECQVTYLTTEDEEELLLVWWPKKGMIGLTHNCKCVDIQANLFTKESVRAYIDSVEESYSLQAIEDKKEVISLYRSMRYE